MPPSRRRRWLGLRLRDIHAALYDAWGSAFTACGSSGGVRCGVQKQNPGRPRSSGVRRHCWRRRRDSNPRSRFWPRCSLSRGVPSTSRPRLPNLRCSREPNNEAHILAAPYRLVNEKSITQHKFSAPLEAFTNGSGLFQLDALCSARTASSMYFSSISTEILISEVEIIWMLMPSSDSVRNILLATPTCERMPTPTTDTFDTFGSPDTLAARRAA